MNDINAAQPTTESANPASAMIDALSTRDILRLINAEDAKVAAAVHAALPEIACAADAITEALSGGGRLFYIGAGTSGRLGILDAVECLPTFGIEPERVQGIIAGGDGALLRSVEGAEDDPDAARQDLLARGFCAKDILCGIAASGSTPYVIGGLRFAAEAGAATIAISCNTATPMLKLARFPIAVDVGAEVIAGSTRMKAGSAQKMILNMLSTSCDDQAGQGLWQPHGRSRGDEPEAGAARYRAGARAHGRGRIQSLAAAGGSR